MPPLPQITKEQFEAIQKESAQIECNNCGLCCRLPSGKYCRNLGWRGDGEERRSYCRIYRRAGRVGSPIGEGQVCSVVTFVPVLYRGCPYNEVKIKHGIVPKDAPVED